MSLSEYVVWWVSIGEELVVYTTLLWLFFIIAANLKQKYEKNPHSLPTRIIAGSFIALFVVGDTIYNFTYGSLLFLQLPSAARPTLTARLKHILRTDPLEYSNQIQRFVHEYWRQPVAKFMCKYMIEPWDFGHCAMAALWKRSGT